MKMKCKSLKRFKINGLTNNWISRFTELRFSEIDIEIRLMISEKNEVVHISVCEYDDMKSIYSNHWWFKGSNPSEQEVLDIAYEMVFETKTYQKMVVKEKLKDFLDEKNS